MQFGKVATGVLLIGVVSLSAQVPAEDWTLEVEPETLTLAVGQKQTLKGIVRDSNGQEVKDATIIYFSRARRNVGVTRDGEVEAYRSGNFMLVALVPRDAEDNSRRPISAVRIEIPVIVTLPPVSQISFVDFPPKFYVGTRPKIEVAMSDTSGTIRHDLQPRYSTSDPSIAEIDVFGFTTLHQAGPVEMSVTVQGVSETVAVVVEGNPVSTLELQASKATALTGDVIRFTAVAKDARGLPVRGVPVNLAVSGETATAIVAAGASAQVTDDGRFVAERSGIYTVVATSGTHVSTRTVMIERRDVGQEVEVVGRGKVLDRHTSDLWLWEGSDGRDYAITGTWGADGHAYIWDVTDPANIVKLREIKVDARTVNDVKVSEDGEIAVISREGASDRKNGIVILGVSNPREGVPVLSEFTDELTGGVHNIFISEDHVFALSASRRYDVISIKDPSNPQRVGRFELDTPGHGIHDVWVSDGVAFSSNWTDGVVAVDVGGGGRGGTPEQPVELGRYAYPSGWNHAAFPYKSQSTGKFYLFAGDESFPYGGYSSDENSTPSRAAGWIHVIDWSDWDHPQEVARYQVPEAGSHNLWVENDVLFAAFYNGGLRVVDVSGELLGDLYRQGREIATYVPYDPDGFIANSPFVWGPQPYKGHIFFTDWNTGLWAVKLRSKDGPGRIIGEPQ